MIPEPASAEIAAARDGLVALETLLVKLTGRCRQLESENADLRVQLASAERAIGTLERLAKSPVRQVQAPGPSPVATAAPVELSTRRCQDCPAFLPKQHAGPPFKRCEACREKARKLYLAARTGKSALVAPPTADCHPTDPPVAETPMRGIQTRTRGIQTPPVSAVKAPQLPPPQAHNEESKVTTSRALERYRREQEQKTAAGAFAASKVLQPERRCGRCCKTYRPLTAIDYYCGDCHDAREREGHVRRVPKPAAELEVAWSGRGALPGQEDRPSNGSQLAPARVAGAGF